jgi:hypothetical protein
MAKQATQGTVYAAKGLELPVNLTEKEAIAS